MNFYQALNRRSLIRNKSITMANINDRLTQNVTGPYYVDSTCIDCDMCRTTAPGFFRQDDGIGSSVVFHQPVTPEEFALAEDGRQSCPTDSIGNDGCAAAETSANS